MIAGYADTTTFVAADNLFSAHVTGNFVVFVYNMIKHSDIHAWLKLLSFPLFIIAVMVGNFIIRSSANVYNTVKLEGLLLVVVGLLAFGLQKSSIANEVSNFLLSLVIVFAMGLQNAFGKLYSTETYAPTTVMTGNVTQITIDAVNYLRKGKGDLQSSASIRNQGVVIGAFFMGCLLGGIAANWVGLTAIIVPGIAILYYFQTHETTHLITK
jgi:uncharacterized membrane protein YoaK (UPF0700 family)